MLLNALIVDDEEYSRKSLYYLIQEHCPEVRVEGIAKSVAEARELIRETHFDLTFLDIAMPKESGFELLPDLQERGIMVIFTTAYDQYALKALKASAVDYLLKPTDIEELQQAVKKAQDWVKLRSESQPAEPGFEDESKITLSHTNGFDVVDTSDIVYIEADSNYSIFHLSNNENIVISKPLKEFEEMLTARNFLRIHKSVIINFRYVKAYSHKNGLQVILNNDITLPVSRRRSNEFQERAKSYFKS